MEYPCHIPRRCNREELIKKIEQQKETIRTIDRHLEDRKKAGKPEGSFRSSRTMAVIELSRLARILANNGETGSRERGSNISPR